jgi:triacylglycerol lipase
MRLNNQFSWKTATFMAKLSEHAYTGLKDFKKTFKKDWKDIKMFSYGGTECYILTCPENYIVVFRGTEPTSWEDIKADVQFRKIGGIHRGFKAALDDVWNQLITDYNANASGKQLLVTGHSLGAALATLYSHRICDSNSVCYTFGSPRTGTPKQTKKMLFTAYRFRNNNDIVTKVPPEFLGFSHKSDKTTYFDVEGNVKEGYSRWYMIKQWFKGTGKGLLKGKVDGFSDHSMGGYHELCQRAGKK